jgi:DNA-binding transcriptional regulator YiaG
MRSVTLCGHNPQPADIRAARLSAGLTQTQAASLVHSSLRAWQQWEAGDRRMHPAFWHLFRAQIGLDHVPSLVPSVGDPGAIPDRL